MKNKPLYSILLTVMLIFGLTVPSVAQAGELWVTNGLAHFVIAVIAGILLAFAFQYLLTNLAVALGISAVGNVQKKGKKKHKKKGKKSGSSSHKSDSKSSSKKSKKPGSMGTKISSAFGIYLTITMAVSLFFASLIAVKLSLVPDNTVGFTIGLVIWAGFLLLMLMIDSKIASSLTGSLFSSVKKVLKAGKSAMGTSKQGKKAKQTAQQTIKGIRQEVRKEFNVKDINKKVTEYVNELKPENKMDNIEKHMADLMKDIRIKEGYTYEDGEAVKELFFEMADEHSSTSGDKKEKMKKAFNKAKETEKSDGSKADKAMSSVDKLAPGEEGKKYRKKVEQYLQQTNEEELQPDKLKNDLNEILNNPKAAPEVVKARASKMDRSTLKSLLSNMKGMNDQKAEKYVNEAEEVLNKIKSKKSESKSSSQSSDQKTKKSNTEKSIKEWLDRMNEPELKYSKIKPEVMEIMDNPKTAPSVLKNQLKQMDHDSMVALVSNNNKISHEQAEKIVDKLEQGRDQVMQKMDKIESKVKEKTQQAEQMALKEAEAVRKTAASAAWWMFIAAVISGGASALGGILALTLEIGL